MKHAIPYIAMFASVLAMNLLDAGDIAQRWMVGLIVFVVAIAWVGRRRE